MKLALVHTRFGLATGVTLAILYTIQHALFKSDYRSVPWFRTKSSLPYPRDPSRFPSISSGRWKTVRTYVGASEKTPRKEWKSSSQVGQDIVVDAIFASVHRPLFFVDLAANHWKDISNSYSLETYAGWNGICIEPNEIYWKGHMHRRCTLVGAVVGRPDEEVVFKTSNHAHGGIVGENMDNHESDNTSTALHTVDIANILSTCGAPKVIDYFSLDVEGAESLVLEFMPFELYKITLFTIERPNDDVRLILRQQNYAEVGILGDFGDTMFLSRDADDFLSLLKLGQEAIMRITANDALDTLGPVKVVSSYNRREVAIGVRCQYFRLDECGGSHPAWDEQFS